MTLREREGVPAAKTYEVRATREGAWWLLTVPELDVVSRCERLHRAEAMVRDLVATWLDVDSASFAVR